LKIILVPKIGLQKQRHSSELKNKGLRSLHHTGTNIRSSNLVPHKSTNRKTENYTENDGKKHFGNKTEKQNCE